MTAPKPPDYTDGLGELVRARRLYLGLSQRSMAARLGIAERSLSDIEVGRRKCPPGFVDSVERVVDSFDEDVKAVIAAAEQSRVGETTVLIEVTADPEKEWRRAVVGRAAVESGLITPKLDGNQATREKPWT